MQMWKKREVNYCLVVGAAMYWATALASLVDTDVRAALGVLHLGTSGGGELLGLTTPMTALLLCAATVCSRLLSQERAWKAAARGVAAVAFAVLALALFAPAVPASSEGPYLFFLVLLRSIESSGLIVLWGYAFASLDKETAGQTVALTVLCALGGYFCLMEVLKFVQQVYVVQPLYILSSAVILSGKVSFANRKRARKRQPRRLAFFFGSRALWGLAIGFISSIALAQKAVASNLLLFVGMAIIAGFLLAYLFSRENLYTALPVFPLIITGLVFLPFLLQGLRGIERSAVAMMWLTWIFLSSFQLSELKETFGMGEAQLCFSEKAVLMTGWSLGALGGSALQAGGLAALDAEEAGGICALVAAYTVILIATYAVFSLVYTRREGELFDEMSLTREQRLEELYDGIAAEYGLSAREREVMEMLAQGYTRTYIRERLVISDGTAKAHIAHVYRKLDIHKKDDLLKLMKAREEGSGSAR